MRCELETRATPTPDLKKVEKAQLMVLDMMAAPLDLGVQVKQETIQGQLTACREMGRSSATSLEQLGRDSFGCLEQRA